MGHQPETVFLINARAGTVIKQGEAALRTLIDDNFGAQPHKIIFCEPDHMEENVSEIHQKNPEARIVIGGGDGTLMHLAPFFINHDIAMGVLPLGTMNFYAKDIGLSPDLAQAVSQSRNLKPRVIDVGCLGEHIFLYCVSIGLIPEASKVREEMRDAPLIVTRMVMIKTLFQELKNLRHRSLKLIPDKGGKPHKCKAVVISNNSLKGDGLGFSDGFKHTDLSDGVLEANMTSPLKVTSFLRICFSILIGKWKAHPLIRTLSCQRFSLHSPHDKLLVAVDGETMTLSTPLSFTIRPKALKIWGPSYPI
ncbi:MAG: diacylglycerol kinase family protein [Pseudobdellovibrionaceae bacterium]